MVRKTKADKRQSRRSKAPLIHDDTSAADHIDEPVDPEIPGTSQQNPQDDAHRQALHSNSEPEDEPFEHVNEDEGDSEGQQPESGQRVKGKSIPGKPGLRKSSANKQVDTKTNATGRRKKEKEVEKRKPRQEKAKSNKKAKKRRRSPSTSSSSDSDSDRASRRRRHKHRRTTGSRKEKDETKPHPIFFEAGINSANEFSAVFDDELEDAVLSVEERSMLAAKLLAVKGSMKGNYPEKRVIMHNLACREVVRMTLKALEGMMTWQDPDEVMSVAGGEPEEFENLLEEEGKRVSDARDKLLFLEAAMVHEHRCAAHSAGSRHGFELVKTVESQDKSVGSFGAVAQKAEDRLDAAETKKQKEQQQQQGRGGSGRGAGRGRGRGFQRGSCYGCGSFGHYIDNCPGAVDLSVPPPGYRGGHRGGYGGGYGRGGYSGSGFGYGGRGGGGYGAGRGGQ